MKYFLVILFHPMSVKKGFVCFIWALPHFQQSFSHIAMVSGCGRELNAHF